MKKIAYLLLITLLFTNCKKNNNEAKDATSEVTVKGKWKSVKLEVELYDADGNIVDRIYHDYEPEDEKSFFVGFDDNTNSIIIRSLNDKKIGIYTYQNNDLTIAFAKEKGTIFVSQLTENNMTWYFEPKLEANNLPLNFPIIRLPITRSFVKTMARLHFIKAN